MEKIPDMLLFRPELKAFLAKNDINYPPSNRFELCFREIEIGLEREVRGERYGLREAHMRHAIAELHELRDIIRTLDKMQIDIDLLRLKMCKILSGTTREMLDELDDEARNIMFELFILTMLHNAGYAPEYEKGNDVRVTLTDGTEFYFECKRLNSISRNSVKDNLKKAYKQVTANIFNDKQIGIIAISIDNYIFDSSKMLFADTTDLVLPFLDEQIKKFIVEYGALWQMRNYVKNSNKVPSVMVCIKGSTFTFQNFTGYAFLTLFNNTCNPPSQNFHLIKNKLPNIIKEI